MAMIAESTLAVFCIFSDLGPESKFYEKMDPGHFLISKEAGVCLAIS